MAERSAAEWKKMEAHVGHAKNKNALFASHKKLFLRPDLKGCVSLPADVANPSPRLRLQSSILRTDPCTAHIQLLPLKEQFTQKNKICLYLLLFTAEQKGEYCI